MKLSLPGMVARAKCAAAEGIDMSMDTIAARRLSALEPGDVVTLRSGGPRMTVVSVSGDQVQCTWFVNGVMVKETIPQSALRYMDLIGSIARWLVSD